MDLASLVKLINYLVSNENEIDFYPQEIIHENIDYMSKAYMLDYIIEPILTKKIDISKRFLQCRAIRTQTDLYAHYACGVECYYRLPDEDTNLITEEEFQERIAQLREKCGDSFINIKEDPYFKHSHLLYDLLELLPEERVKW